MQTGEYKGRFLKRAAVDLADNEKVSLWEPLRSASVQFEKDAIRFDGKWRVSAIGNFLGSGLLGEFLIKPFFLKERTETISVQNLERAVIHQKKKTVTFHLFQMRDQGMVEVHVFVADNDAVPEVLESLKAVVPADRLQEQHAG